VSSEEKDSEASWSSWRVLIRLYNWMFPGISLGARTKRHEVGSLRIDTGNPN
jgi:hypothetical protein